METIHVKKCTECDNFELVKKLADRINANELEEMKILVCIEHYKAENRKLRKLYSELLKTSKI